MKRLITVKCARWPTCDWAELSEFGEPGLLDLTVSSVVAGDSQNKESSMILTPETAMILAQSLIKWAEGK